VTVAAAPIVLCYDGSEVSAAAIARAGALLGGGSALVCHAWLGPSVIHGAGPLLPAGLGGAVEGLDQAGREAAERTAAEGVQLAAAAGFDARPLTAKEHHKTWRTLLAEAERHEARLVVVGAHGLSGVRRALLGSVSNAVVTHSAIPVLAIPSGANSSGAGVQLLLCYDGSDGAKRAIRQAGGLFPGRDALVLHLWESWVAEAPSLAGISGSVRSMARDVDELVETESARMTTEGLALARGAGFAAEPISRRTDGPVWKGVLESAAEHDVSAIVVGSRGLTGISAALGSVAHGVVHHSARPVLVVPPGDPDQR
jgi:nucleotide-binding universal stress UspA family protein